MENNLENLTIGVFAKAAGVNVETIRFYQRKGLLPEPDKPVMTISLSRGNSRSMFFRLCVRAPRIRILSMRIGSAESLCEEAWVETHRARVGAAKAGTITALTISRPLPSFLLPA